jgi:anti-sigma B factor antagonist
MDIALTERPDHGAVVVTLAGHCDVDSAPDMQTAFESLIRRPATRIVADLSGLDFCDSTGLSSLVIAHNACTGAGGWLRLAGPTPFLTRVLGVVGLLDRVPAYASVPAALDGDPAGRISVSPD